MNRRQAVVLSTIILWFVLFFGGSMYAYFVGEYYLMAGLVLAGMFALILMALVGPRVRKWVTGKL